MGRLKALPIAIAIILSIQLICSCTESYCDSSGSDIPLVGLYAMESPDTEVYIDSVSIYGIDQINDSILYNNETSLSTFYTPLDPTKDSVQYVISYNKEAISPEYKYDTLTYKYTSTVKFDTPECGAVYEYYINEFKYTTYSIQYASLITPVVNNLTDETIHIFYAVQE